MISVTAKIGDRKMVDIVSVIKSGSIDEAKDVAHHLRAHGAKEVLICDSYGYLGASDSTLYNVKIMSFDDAGILRWVG